MTADPNDFITTDGQITSNLGRARLMVADSAAILKRLYFLQRELVLMQAGWIPGSEHWESKLLLPELLWEDALIASQIRKRVLELRYPDRRIVPDADAPFLDQWRTTQNAPSGVAFTTGSLPILKRFLRQAYVQYMSVADALNDGPTIRILRHAVDDIDRQLARLAEASLTVTAVDPRGRQWCERLASALSVCHPSSVLGETPPRLAFEWEAAGGRAFVFARRVQRDSRFRRPLFAWPDRLDNTRGPGEGIELQIRAAVHHANEAWAAEMAASVLRDFADEAPPEFLEEAARWCYDEIRHCRMGYARLLEWGFRPEEIPLDTFSYDASAEADPLIRLGTIYYFETTYIHTKSERTKIFTRTGDRLSAHDMDFDWADELIHTHYGSRWLKHFIAVRRDPRSPEDIKARAQALVHCIQQAATQADRDETAAIHRSVLARARELAVKSRASEAPPRAVGR